MPRPPPPALRSLALLLLAAPGCALFLGGATGRLAEDLSRAVLEQGDVATVRDGAPAYLILIDGLIEGDPESEPLLLSGARLYGAYAAAFVSEPERARRLTGRALDYARRALCGRDAALCRAAEGPAEPFAAALPRAGRGDVPVLYGFGAAWAGWIQAHASEPDAMAELPKLEALMRRIVELDEGTDHAGAHLALGVLLCQRPAQLGGAPEAGRAHFERALALTGRRHLTVQLLFARHYARLVFDRELHDALLREVLAADPEAPGLTLANTLAQEEARQLLDEADEYF